MLAILYSINMFVSSTSNDDINVFILAGQSNMVGQGGVAYGNANRTDKWDGIIPPECESNPSILRLGANMRWEEAREPLHSLDNSFVSFGVGPGMPFANSILKRDPTIGVIGLVPSAVSGSSISTWSRNNTNYRNMLKLVKAAISEGGVLRGFLWYQGESDSKYLATAEAYGGRLKELFNNVRFDFESPMLPIIHVALASGLDYIETVRHAQLQTHLPNVKCVDAVGLQLEPPEKLHLSTPAQVQLGTMLADAFLHLQPTNK